MNTTKMTIRLPEEEVHFAKGYARRHGMTLTALVHRYFDDLKAAETTEEHPRLDAITGLVPSDIDATDEHIKHQLSKHQ